MAALDTVVENRNDVELGTPQEQNPRQTAIAPPAVGIHLL
jgi:hypothetical protein